MLKQYSTHQIVFPC